MRKFAMLAAICAAICAPVMAPAHGALGVYTPDAAVFHGGGCRKSSPPGKCCHAGSKPLHCH
jgi:hypothetical protein